MNQENLNVLIQHVHALEEAVVKLEIAYHNKDIESIRELKKFILEVKSHIDTLTK